MNVLLWLAVSATTALAAPPTTFHQGRLLDANGEPLNGPVDVVFALYTTDQIASSEWSEPHTLQLEDGYYGVVLGNDTPLTPSLLAAHESV